MEWNIKRARITHCSQCLEQLLKESTEFETEANEYYSDFDEEVNGEIDESFAEEIATDEMVNGLFKVVRI